MEVLKSIIGSRIIAISRGNYGEDLIFAACALYEGGVRAFEVTFEQDKPEALTADSIAQLAESLPDDAVIGAGTVMNAEQVRIAHEAGASFIISPNTCREVIETTKRLGMVSIPGAMTPTEIAEAYSLGADIVKLFPAGVLGIEYFKAVRAPLKHIPLAAVAGITAENIKAFSDAGAAAYGISSSLFIKKAIKDRDAEAIKKAAEAFYAAINN